MAYKSIQNTFIFNFLEKDNISRRIMEGFKGKELTRENLAEQFLAIELHESSKIKQRVLSEYNEGAIKLIYAPEDAGITSSIPFVMRPMGGGKLQAVVFLNPFGNLRQDGTMNIATKKLFVLMESAYFAKNFLENYNRYRNDNVLIQQGAILYANMFVKPINKQFNLNLDRERENKVMFLAAKFYLKNVLGLQNEEVIFNVAMKACIGGNPFILKEVNMIVEEEAFENLGSFIEALQDERLHLNLKGLQVRGYIYSFVSMYKPSALFALEMLPYFLFAGNASMVPLDIVNVNALQPVMEKGIPKILSKFYY